MEGKTPRSGYAPVNGLQLYYEIHGTGQPLVLLHGGLGMTEMFGDLLPRLAQGRQVIAVDLQGHGRTADIDRPIRLEQMADDIAALTRHLGFSQVDFMGYSMGGGVALRVAIHHSTLVRRLVLVSVPFRRDGWYPEVVAAMEQVGAAAAPFMRESPQYQAYTAVAPDPTRFPALLDKIGDSLRQDYDLTSGVAALRIPTLLVYGDADSISPAHMVEFFGLLGGGKGDAGWDRAKMPVSRLAILPATTHYDIFASPLLAAVVTPFLDAPVQPAAGAGVQG